MKRKYPILRFLLLLSLFAPFSVAHSAPVDPEIIKSYIASDYETAARLLEEQIKGQSHKADFFDLYKKYLLLSHLYAWRLSQPDIALLKYHELSELRRSDQTASKLPPFELLYTAEIYEAKNEYGKAEEYYQHLLKELMAYQSKENDGFAMLVGEDLLKFLKYQIDGLHLKSGTEKSQKPLLTRLKLSSQLAHAFFPFMVMALAPAGEYVFPKGVAVDLDHIIRQSPPDLSSMILNYAMILTTSASTVDESSEEAMEAYLAKYPESYYSLQLRYLFYRFYKESGEAHKAQELAKDLKKVGRKRGLELIIEPEERFASPERTWDTYRKALIAADIDLAMDCYAPGRRRHAKLLNAFGRDRMKEMGESLGDLHKVTAGETMAEYMIIKRKDEKELSYPIRFHQIDGEWKMEEF